MVSVWQTLTWQTLQERDTLSIGQMPTAKNPQNRKLANCVCSTSACSPRAVAAW